MTMNMTEEPEPCQVCGETADDEYLCREGSWCSSHHSEFCRDSSCWEFDLDFGDYDDS